MKTILYTGTFDPPTNGHIAIVKALATINDVDTVYVCPSFNPLKQNISKFINRIEMCSIAFGNLAENVLVSKFETELFELTKGYTYNLVSELKDYCGSDISIVIGYDLIDQIPTLWHKGNELIDQFKFIIIPRNDINGKLIDVKETWYKNPKHLILDVEPTSYSSSEIRSLIANKLDYSNKIPENLINYIKDNKLYELN